MNEVVRQIFAAQTIYQVPFAGQMNGVNIWILFKIAFIMPVSGLYAWFLTRLMQPHRIDPPSTSSQDAGHTLAGAGGGGQAYALAKAHSSRSPQK